ncbi:hypothetical protein BD769DRAFT_522342 [Suillus cothurnatus]|nr:hypothetical protein BD769DRAFT_522342 [Suillus cothurnatus]
MGPAELPCLYESTIPRHSSAIFQFPGTASNRTTRRPHEELAFNGIRCLISAGSQQWSFQPGIKVAAYPQAIISFYQQPTSLDQYSTESSINHEPHDPHWTVQDQQCLVPKPIKVEVTDLVQHLATLYDTRTGLYIGVDTQDGKVKGYTDPHVLQLSSDDGIKFEIHPKDLNDVWYLKDGGNWTFIIVEPAPISEGKYWKFDKV